MFTAIIGFCVAFFSAVGYLLNSLGSKNERIRQVEQALENAKKRSGVDEKVNKMDSDSVSGELSKWMRESKPK